MSKNDDFLPRVTIETSDSSGTLDVNFRLSTSGVKDVPDGLKALFATLEDWTSFCIASIAHMPFMSSVGHFVVEKSVQEKLIGHLMEESVSHEEVSLDEKGNRKRFSFVIHEDDVQYIASELSGTSQMIKAARAIQRSNLSAIIAEFDYLVFRSLNAVGRDFPDVLVPNEEKIEVGILRSGKSFEEWQSDRIQEAVEGKLRESHKKIVEWVLTEVAGLQDLSPVLKSPFFKEFLEICQRRHLLIHNGGTVNADYLKHCLEAGIKEESLPALGETLDVDSLYLRRSAARVYLIGAFTMYLVAQNAYPGHKTIAHRMLLSASHDFLHAGMTKMASRLIEFAEFNSKAFDQDLKLKFGINKALAKLFEPNVDEATQTKNAGEVLANYDWSVTTPVFDLALTCVKRDFTKLIPLAKAAYTAGLTYREVRYYVVFKEAREREGFMECFPKSNLLIEDKSN